MAAPTGATGGAGTESPVLVGVDWGTTSARAYAFAADGRVLGETHGPFGVQQIGNLGYPDALQRLCAPWSAVLATTPVLACGMVGSRQGWQEAPYVTCPAGIDQLAAAVVPVATRVADVALVPGLACRRSDGFPDVMRGEETQIAGLSDLSAAPTGEPGGSPTMDGDGRDAGTRVVVLPGTHSKWARIEAGRVVHFTTFMTGELFAVLRAHSILGRLALPGDGDGEAFGTGVDVSLAAARAGGSLLGDLFTVRARALFGELPGNAVEDYLSGVLIGSELGAAMAGAAAGVDVVTLIGDPVLCERYARAVGHAGLRASIADPRTTPRGLWRIALRSGRLRLPSTRYSGT